MHRFINDDVKLKKGGRKAVKLTVHELEQKMIQAAQQFDEDIVDEWEALCTLIEEDPHDDLKYLINTENITADASEDFGTIIQGQSLVSSRTLENGLTFYGFEMGGDWEYPVFAICYYDGKKIRFYIPSYGNPVNLDFKTALHSETESNIVKLSSIIKKYQKLNLLDKSINETNLQHKMLHGEIDMAELYCQKYALTSEDIGFNFDAIKKDIMSRIEIV